MSENFNFEDEPPQKSQIKGKILVKNINNIFTKCLANLIPFLR